VKRITKKCFKLVIAAAIAGVSLSGCGTITNAHVRHLSDQQLVLARLQVWRRLNGPHYSSGRLGDDGDISSQQRELESVEREMMKRGIIIPLTTPQQIQQTEQIKYGNPRPLYQ
jgi:hypothetical protein